MNAPYKVDCETMGELEGKHRCYEMHGPDWQPFPGPGLGLKEAEVGFNGRFFVVPDGLEELKPEMPRMYRSDCSHSTLGPPRHL